MGGESEKQSSPMEPRLTMLGPAKRIGNAGLLCHGLCVRVGVWLLTSWELLPPTHCWLGVFVLYQAGSPSIPHGGGLSSPAIPHWSGAAGLEYACCHCHKRQRSEFEKRRDGRMGVGTQHTQEMNNMSIYIKGSKDLTCLLKIRKFCLEQAASALVIHSALVGHVLEDGLVGSLPAIQEPGRAFSILKVEPHHLWFAGVSIQRTHLVVHGQIPEFVFGEGKVGDQRGDDRHEEAERHTSLHGHCVRTRERYSVRSGPGCDGWSHLCSACVCVNV